MSFINQFMKLLNIPDSDSSESELTIDLDRKSPISHYDEESSCGEEGQDEAGAGAGPSGAKVIRVGPVEVTRGRIPRPPNAFMIYANTWRRKLAKLFAGESNKQISVRLGKLWKAMSPEEKETYFTLAKRVDAEHKKKYPDYVYNPKEARLRKALRDQGKLHRPKQKWKSHTDPPHLLLPIMVMRRRGGEEESRNEMLQSSYQDHLSYGHHHQMAPPTHHEYHPHHPSLSWYNNYLHTGGSGGDYLPREEKTSWTFNGHPTGETSYTPLPPEGGQYSGVMMGMESPLMMQESSLMMSPDQHHNGGLLQNGTSQPPVHQSPLHPSTAIKEEEESLPKLDGPQATPVEPKKDVLKLPGFHQTFGNITEIGRFSQPDEFFESRPPEIPDPPPPKEHLVSEYEEPYSQESLCMWVSTSSETNRRSARESHRPEETGTTSSKESAASATFSEMHEIIASLGFPTSPNLDNGNNNSVSIFKNTNMMKFIDSDGRREMMDECDGSWSQPLSSDIEELMMVRQEDIPPTQNLCLV